MSRALESLSICNEHLISLSDRAMARLSCQCKAVLPLATTEEPRGILRRLNASVTQHHSAHLTILKLLVRSS